MGVFARVMTWEAPPAALIAKLHGQNNVLLSWPCAFYSVVFPSGKVTSETNGEKRTKCFISSLQFFPFFSFFLSSFFSFFAVAPSPLQWNDVPMMPNGKKVENKKLPSSPLLYLEVLIQLFGYIKGKMKVYTLPRLTTTTLDPGWFSIDQRLSSRRQSVKGIFSNS